MARKLSVTKSGLLQRARRALREVEQLQAMLADTAGAHVQATTDADAADAALDTLFGTINAL